VVLEQEALLALAAYQPAGSDLRRIAASLELVAELERIGDYAADRARILLREKWDQLPGNLTAGIAQMGDAALGMLRDALRAFTREGGDEALARAVAAWDDQVDALQRAAIDAVVDLIRDNPAVAAPARPWPCPGSPTITSVSPIARLISPSAWSISRPVKSPT